MSTPGGIGVYLSPGARPSRVDERPWRGIYHHAYAGPDVLGQVLIDRVVQATGNLEAVVRDVIDAVQPNGWASLEDGERLDPGDPPMDVSPEDTTNTCWVYLFDVAARRLDVFATDSEASGEWIGSVTFSAGGTPTPLRFKVITPPPRQHEPQPWIPRPWQAFRHADGRAWAIRATETGYELRFGEGEDTTFRQRVSQRTTSDIAELVYDIEREGFVREPPR
jgi:hypothetical protein